jgi:hypothetical protein
MMIYEPEFEPFSDEEIEYERLKEVASKSELSRMLLLHKKPRIDTQQDPNDDPADHQPIGISEVISPEGC